MFRRISVVSVLGIVMFGIGSLRGVQAQSLMWGRVPAAELLLDLAVPESPAFTLLGLSPQNIVRPATPRTLATSLLSGIDRNGHFQAGLALSVSPYMLLAGDSLTLEEYRKEANWWQRVLANTQVSLATTKGTEKADDAVRLGFGVRTILWNRGDPRRDPLLQECLLKNVKPPLLIEFPNRDAWEEAFKAYPEKGAPIAAKCRTESEKRNWNASSLELAAAPSFIQKTGSDDNIAFGGAAFWTSLAWGFDGIKSLQETSQLIVHVRYTLDQETPDPNIKDRFFKQDTLIAGLRVRIGKPTLNVSFEGSFIHADPEGARSDDSYSTSLGTDIKVMQNVWLQLAVGGTGSRRGENRIFLLAEIKWGGQSFDPVSIASKALVHHQTTSLGMARGGP